MGKKNPSLDFALQISKYSYLYILTYTYKNTSKYAYLLTWKSVLPEKSPWLGRDGGCFPFGRDLA